MQYFKEEILESLGNTVLKSVQCSWEVQDEDSTWLTLFDNQKAIDDFNQGNFSAVTGVTGSDRERSPVIDSGSKSEGEVWKDSCGSGLKIGHVCEGTEGDGTEARGTSTSSKGFLIYLLRVCGKIRHGQCDGGFEAEERGDKGVVPGNIKAFVKKLLPFF